ncbi:hypothetical protein [Ornithinibacillus contaminans]|uniref:hypothetical protein n=1 Tax=Ornithinibacillus contaminans TaxID=694055 RepID=UPI00064DFCF0|nr:hypothetical protein [Ornithinibacillus contaminans]
MSIQKIIGSPAARIKDLEQNLRSGQIIQGRILKLFPTNKALIQLGPQQMVAQLEASLEMGARYHFQVQSGENLLYLKVLGNALKVNDPFVVLDLLKQLGLNQSKVNQTFVEGLLQQKIPFDKQQLQQALPLLDAASNKSLAQAVLYEMIARKLPIRPAVFQAFYTKQDNTLANLLSTLQQTLQAPSSVSPSLKGELLQQLSQLTGQPIAVPNKLVGPNLTDLQAQPRINHPAEISVAKLNVNGEESTGNQVPVRSLEAAVKQLVQLTQQPSLFHVLKATGVIARDVQLSDWRNQISQLMDGGGPAKQSDAITLTKAITQVVDKFPQLQQLSNTVLQQWGNILHTSIANGVSLTGEQFAKLDQEVQQKLGQLVPTSSHQLQNTPVSLRNLIIDLEILANEQNGRTMEPLVQQSIKHQFLEQTQFVLQQTGIQYEKAIADGQQVPEATIKSMLLQLIGQADGTTQEQANKLLQFINGMQLQSVTETDSIIQAAISIPAEKLGLQRDMELEFEGKKTESGDINPDYCRIIFYLDLAHLKKTVIDMNVQKRAITLTVLNDQNISAITNSFKPALKEGLEKLNYQLTSISCKPLTNKEAKTVAKSVNHAQRVSYQGVDFRI